MSKDCNIDYLLLWAIVLENNGIMRFTKRELDIGRKKLELREFSEGSILAQYILKKIQIVTNGRPWRRRDRAAVKSITGRTLKEMHKQTPILVDEELLALAALYVQRPAQDFSHLLGTSPDAFVDLNCTLTSGRAMEVRCWREGYPEPAGYDTWLKALTESRTPEDLNRYLDFLYTEDPDDLSTLCPQVFWVATKMLDQEDPATKEIAIRMGRQYVERLPEIVEVATRDWGMPNMPFLNSYAKYMEKLGMIDEAIDVLEIAIENRLPLGGDADGYVRCLKHMKRRHKRT